MFSIHLVWVVVQKLPALRDAHCLKSDVNTTEPFTPGEQTALIWTRTTSISPKPCNHLAQTHTHTHFPDSIKCVLTPSIMFGSLTPRPLNTVAPIPNHRARKIRTATKQIYYASSSEHKLWFFFCIDRFSKHAIRLCQHTPVNYVKITGLCACFGRYFFGSNRYTDKNTRAGQTRSDYRSPIPTQHTTIILYL